VFAAWLRRGRGSARRKGIRPSLVKGGFPQDLGKLQEVAGLDLWMSEERVAEGVRGLISLLAQLGDTREDLLDPVMKGAARIKLGRPDLNRYFPFGGFGSDAKDRTALIHKAIERGMTLLGRSQQEIKVFVIGDTDLDITCGRQAGATTVAVATGGDSWEILLQASPDHLLKDLSRPEEFLAILSDRTQRPPSA